MHNGSRVHPHCLWNYLHAPIYRHTHTHAIQRCRRKGCSSLYRHQICNCILLLSQQQAGGQHAWHRLQTEGPECAGGRTPPHTCVTHYCLQDCASSVRIAACTPRQPASQGVITRAHLSAPPAQPRARAAAHTVSTKEHLCALRHSCTQ